MYNQATQPSTSKTIPASITKPYQAGDPQAIRKVLKNQMRLVAQSIFAIRTHEEKLVQAKPGQPVDEVSFVRLAKFKGEGYYALRKLKTLARAGLPDSTEKHNVLEYCTRLQREVTQHGHMNVKQVKQRFGKALATSKRLRAEVALLREVVNEGLFDLASLLDMTATRALQPGVQGKDPSSKA